MEIRTKYNIGDEVWAIYQHQAIQFCVKGIKIYVHCRGTVIEYILVYKPVQTNEDDILCADIDIQETYLEKHIFPTKEELLKSL